MVISERPVFAETDRAGIRPRDGIWLSADDDCQFDSALPETQWPQCAMWIVVRGSNFVILDGKGQTEQTTALLTVGQPNVIQFEWADTAKDNRVYYGFYAIEPGKVGADGRFVAATVWVVECGTQTSAAASIIPFPGITAECRPTSPESIRSAAHRSRREDQIERWSWLRAEAPFAQPTSSSSLKK